MDKVRLIDADALDAQINAAQNSVVSNDDKQWSSDKKYFKGLAWSRRLLRQSPTIVKVNSSEIAGIRALVYRNQIPDVKFEPIIYAYWESTSLDDKHGIAFGRCSNCHEEAWSNYKLTPRCPYCGAHMTEKNFFDKDIDI